MTEIIFYWLMLVPYAAAAAVDAKTMEIPEWIFPATALVRAATLAASRGSFTNAITGAAVMGVPVLLSCFIGAMGGGDFIMLACAGFCVGFGNAAAYAASLAVGGTAYMLVSGKRGRIAIAPMALVSHLVFTIWRTVIYVYG